MKAKPTCGWEPDLMILPTRPTHTQRGKNVLYKKLKVPVVMILEMFWLVHK